mmetsp:Transcript_29434/g.53916  ORF Transcript_29434/g.53916 Transcript_29434/m.53916 type:complete len:473 (-) Transcript_29434:147-1565(-)
MNRFQRRRLALLLAVVAAAPSATNAIQTPRSSTIVAKKQSWTQTPLPARGGDQVGEGTASMSTEIFNLVKGIVGVGVLSLPAGVAAFGDAPSALIPAIGLVVAFGALSGYCFSLIGRVCSYTGATSYRGAWDRTLGSATSSLPAWACTLQTFSATLAYSMVLGDTFQSLMQTVGISGISRTTTILGITSFILLPLCLLKNLSSLAPFSLLGIIGMAYTTLAMAIRYFGKSYVGGALFLDQVIPNLRPSFGSKGAASVLNPNASILIGMLSTAYMAHFNAPKFYMELKDNTIARYNTVVGTSFGISIVIMALLTALGFLTFGSASSGLILNNYSTKDSLMSLSRVAVAFSIVFSYPLAFVGFRDGTLDLLQVAPEKRTNTLLNQLTVSLLAVITVVALSVTDLSFVLSFGGATLGNALIYVFPALMFAKSVKQMGDDASRALQIEVYAALASAVLGVVLGGMGAKMALGKLNA